MRVAITGSEGVVGRAVKEQLEAGGYEILPIDLPEVDAADFDALLAATEGADAIIHLAWKNLRANALAGRVDPANNYMTFNVYEAAVRNGIKRVLMASSNHAHAHDIRDKDSRIRIDTLPNNTPNNPYGAEKLYMEALGRHFARTHRLEIVCLRIGNLNEEDKPKPSSAENPQRWISKRDMGRLVIACLEAEEVPSGFQAVYAVSGQKVFDWSNPFGYEPLDRAE